MTQQTEGNPDPGGTVGIEHSEPEDRADEEDECFDVQAWAEAYLQDAEAQAEHAKFPGVPFH